ncbi:uncharacterized protein LAJ45_09946 [Morchella importuna]|uniref:uncharacterized protein n=1 Tax=Morchella importuna TaxID=1174673 RepID=UPI001E8E01A2|nr:uncharacterized protein LAJ45_09946 [Morchella importuna]KAH8146024.1 hypothetical protein LAJ45_09946 [Morchella importuna]
MGMGLGKGGKKRKNIAVSGAAGPASHMCIENCPQILRLSLCTRALPKSKDINTHRDHNFTYHHSYQHGISHRIPPGTSAWRLPSGLWNVTPAGLQPLE